MTMESPEMEELRRTMQAALNHFALPREDLEAQWGQVWDTSQLTTEYVVEAFLAPYVMLVRRADAVRGTMLFQHYPRFYFAWEKVQ